MANSIIIFGAGHLGRLSKEIFEQNNLVVYGFLDEDKILRNKEVDDVMVLGGLEEEEFVNLIGKKCEAFIALDDNALRKNIATKLWANRQVKPLNAIHKTVSMPRNASVGYGNFVDNNTLFGVGATLGNHCIVNMQSTIGVDTQISDFVQIGAGSLLGHEVTVEEDVFLGAGVTIASGVTIGKKARIAIGSVVIASVPEGDTVMGNPAKRVNM